jgi:hypothetical protein
MKKVILLLSLFVSVTASAQFQKGTRTFGLSLGSVGFSNTGADATNNTGTLIGSDKTSRFNISINPSYGWFISEKVLVGGSISVGVSSSKYTAGTTTVEKSNGFNGGLGVYSRYYFSADGFMPYAQASLGGTIGSVSFTWTRDLRASFNSIDKGEADQKSIFNLNAGLGVGLTKMVNKNVGLDIGLGYVFTNTSYKYSSINNRQYQTTPPSSEELRSNFKYSGFTNAVNLSVGFLVFFDAKK